jgi:XisH protein
MIDSERVLFLAIPESIYIRFFEESVIQKTMQEERFKLVIYNQTTQIITQWIES